MSHVQAKDVRWLLARPHPRREAASTTPHPAAQPTRTAQAARATSELHPLDGRLGLRLHEPLAELAQLLAPLDLRGRRGGVELLQPLQRVRLRLGRARLGRPRAPRRVRRALLRVRRVRPPRSACLLGRASCSPS